jgi:hypothetical protein
MDARGVDKVHELQRKPVAQTITHSSAAKALDFHPSGRVGSMVGALYSS